MGKSGKRAAPAQRPAAEARKEYEAEGLTGKRAQNRQGYTYEVKWKNGPGGKVWPNSFQPPENLIGWEAEMKKVDYDIARRSTQAFLKPVAEKRARDEAATQAKAAALLKRREQLMRKKRRLERSRCRGEDSDGGEDSDEEDSDEDEESDASEDEDLPNDSEQLLAELETIARAMGANTTTTTASPCTSTEGAANEGTSTSAPAGVSAHHKRPGKSRVWLAFSRETNRCQLPDRKDKTKTCDQLPKKGTGTSGHIAHLQAEHPEEWLYIKTTGERKTTVHMIEDALKAKVDESKPALGEKETAELNRLVAVWVTKCGRSQKIVEDAELRAVLARILELCKAKLRYELPCQETVRKEMKLLGHAGKALGRDFLVRLIKSGVKPSISGDLWSDSGMGLFGIYAHGITDTWVLEKALIGLVACESERHTAENIKKWTKEALQSIGLTEEGLLPQDS